MEIDSFVVKQERGQDSWVNVEEGFIYGYPNDKKTLVFITEQSLHSNSDRAWNVEKAIEQYANEQGYEVQKPYEDKFKVVAIYSEDHYSRMLAYKLREEIKKHPVFLDASEEAKAEADRLDKEYGKHIADLKYLIYLLEKSLDKKLKEIATLLVNEQIEIIEELGSDGIKDYHLFADKHPLVEIKPHYYKTSNDIPDSLDDILPLLDKE